MELTDPTLDHEEAVSHTDAMYEDDVLRFALRAAAEAKARLTAKYPSRPRMGYLSFQDEKTLYQTISDGSGQPLSQIEVLKVDEKDENESAEIADPIDYLTYGPYGSYTPTFDARLADLNEPKRDQDKEERKNMYKIYGGEKELYYVQSLQVFWIFRNCFELNRIIKNFVADMPGPVVDAVETILNKLTDGLHETTRLNRFLN